MSDMNDFSKDNNFNFLCHNDDKLNSGFGGIVFSEGGHRPENIFPSVQTYNLHITVKESTVYG
jgi:hypothetical protein